MATSRKDRVIIFVSVIVCIYAMGAWAEWYTINYAPEVYEKTQREWEGGWAGVIERALQ